MKAICLILHLKTLRQKQFVTLAILSVENYCNAISYSQAVHSILRSRHMVVCHAAKEAGMAHREYI